MRRIQSIPIHTGLLTFLSLVGCRSDPLDHPHPSVAQATQAASTDGQVCLTVQRGTSGQVADAILWQNAPTWTDGAATRLSTGTSAQGGVRRPLLSFDLSAVPPGAVVLSANLRLQQLYKSGPASTMGLYPVTAPWSEAAATWNALSTSFSSPAAASLTSVSGSGTLHTVDLTSLARSWVNGSIANRGLMLIEDPASGTYTEFRSSETSSADQRPRLDLCYVTCADGIQNGAETGVDCGGPDCGSCGFQPQGTSVLVQVLDASGAPVASAAVIVDGVIHATDGAGRLVLDGLPPGRFVAEVRSPGHAPASVVVDLAPGAHTGAEAHLLPVGAPIPFNADEGAVVAQDDVQVLIPPGALVDPNGDPVTGEVEATIVPFDPTVESLGNLPGPLEGIAAAGGAVVGLESVVMAEVSLWQDNVPLQLAPGATATLTLPIPAALTGQVTEGGWIPAWWFDLDDGIWREEGVGTVQQDPADPSKLVWVVDVHHFTWWNCDKPWTQKSCFNITLVDPSGDPVGGMLVGANGTSYIGSSMQTTTDVAGHTCVDIMNNGAAELYVGNYTSSIGPLVSLNGAGPASACSGGGAACTPVTVTIPANSVCTPGEFVPCPYSGPPGTQGVGLCGGGANYCNGTGTGWTGCTGEVLPQPESCVTPFDDDCDGLTNEEGADCNCTPGDTAACYTGPAGTLGVGICSAGTRTCDADGLGYGPCSDVTPQPETCANPADEDCDGSASCGGLHVWSRHIAGFWDDLAPAITTDSAGNAIISGSANYQVDLGGGPLWTWDGPYVAKFDSSGNHIWSTALGSASFSSWFQTGIGLDAAGNIMLAANLAAGTAYFQDGPIGDPNSQNVVVVKLDPNGNYLWSKAFSGSGSIDSMSMDDSGNFLLAGTAYGTIDFGGGPIGGATNYAAFIAKLDPDGNHLWSKAFPSAGSFSSCIGVDIDSNGNVLLTGYADGAIDMGGGPFGGPNGYSFIAKLDPDGIHLWSKGFASPGSWSVGRAVATDASDNVVLTGDATGTIDLGGGSIGTVGKYVFAAKLDPAGNHVWSRAAGGTLNTIIGMDVETDSVGNVVLTGYHQGIIDFGGAPLGAINTDGRYVVKLSPTGNHVWSKSLAYVTWWMSNGATLAVDLTDHILVSGEFYQSVNLGGGVWTTDDTADALIVKLTP